MFRSTGNIGKLRASRERATAVDVGRVSPNPVAIVKVKKIDSLRPIQRRMDHRNGHFIASSPDATQWNPGAQFPRITQSFIRASLKRPLLSSPRAYIFISFSFLGNFDQFMFKDKSFQASLRGQCRTM